MSNQYCSFVAVSAGTNELLLATAADRDLTDAIRRLAACCGLGFV